MHCETSANKLRPRAFSELAGQDFVVKTLIGSLISERTAHAYLFSGPRGVGKTSAARLLALAVNRPHGTDISNLDYEGSDDIRHGHSLDVIEIDGASYTSVENIRSIREELMYKPVQFAYKVYIIDEVHMLSNSAFNALLKTIEEPPEYAVFIFATTELHKVPATIRSRCQQFAFKRISIQDITQKLCTLVENNSAVADKDALMWIAKEAEGSLRDAYMLLDQILSFDFEKITLENIKKHLGLAGIDTLNDLFLCCIRGERKAVLERVNALLDSGVSPEQLVFESSEYLRNILFIKNEITSASLIGYAVSQFDAAVYTDISDEQIERALELMLQCYRNIRYTANQRFEIELTMSALCTLSAYVSPAQLVSRLEALREPAGQDSGGAEVSPAEPKLQAEKSADIFPTNSPEKTASSAPKKQEQDLWTKILSEAHKHNERLGAALDSADAKLENQTLVISFKDKFAYSVFEEYSQFVQSAALSAYGKPITIKGSLDPSISISPLSVQENCGEEYTPAVKSVLKIFGGSVQNNE